VDRGLPSPPEYRHCSSDVVRCRCATPYPCHPSYLALAAPVRHLVTFTAALLPGTVPSLANPLSRTLTAFWSAMLPYRHDVSAGFWRCTVVRPGHERYCRHPGGRGESRGGVHCTASSRHHMVPLCPRYHARPGDEGGGAPELFSPPRWRAAFRRSAVAPSHDRAGYLQPLYAAHCVAPNIS